MKYRLPKQLADARLIQYLLAVTIIGTTALICYPLSNTQNYTLVSFILLLVVSALSTFMKIGPVLLASTLGAVLWNFFFIPPHHTFHIDKTEDILIFFLFFFIALVNGVLTTRVRKQEVIAREREKRTNALFQLTKELTKASGLSTVQNTASSEINERFRLKPVFFLQDGNNKLTNKTKSLTQSEFTEKDFAIAEWVFSNSREAGAFTTHFSDSKYTFYPLIGIRLNPGVLAVQQETAFHDEHKLYWETFITQISNALEREFLGEMAQKVLFLNESDRLYKTLFNSISHELRIPVATIMGASDSIVNSSTSETTHKDLCLEIYTASLRLNRLIENLLNMSRLESGFLSARLDWYDTNDLMNKVIDNLKDELSRFQLQVDIPEDMPLVKIDFGLMEQVLYNLLLNATQIAPAGSVIVLKTRHKNDRMIIEVTDNGPGFPEPEIKYIFNKFYRITNKNAGGLGLGLSIVKGFVEAHNGQITIGNNTEHGARCVISLPSEKPDIIIREL